MNELPVLQVSQAVELINRSLELSLPMLVVEGEVSEYRLSQGRWVRFSLKDGEALVKCFMTIDQLGFELEDGMKVTIEARPALHKLYGFQLLPQSISPSGEGSIKRAFELSKKKLTAEGLFDESRKRALPQFPERIGLITSKEAAAYRDVLKILETRWPLAEVVHAQSLVQGREAPKDLVAAIKKLNELSPAVELIIMTRGGGSLEDMAAFNDESVVRAVVASRAPMVVAVGHERDESLAELAADVRATTPTNAAQLAVPNAVEVANDIDGSRQVMLSALRSYLAEIKADFLGVVHRLSSNVDRVGEWLQRAKDSFRELSPERVLARGYAIVSDESGQLVSDGSKLEAGDIIRTKFKKGSASSRVEDASG